MIQIKNMMIVLNQGYYPTHMILSKSFKSANRLFYFVKEQWKSITNHQVNPDNNGKYDWTTRDVLIRKHCIIHTALTLDRLHSVKLLSYINITTSTKVFVDKPKNISAADAASILFICFFWIEPPAKLIDVVLSAFSIHFYSVFWMIRGAFFFYFWMANAWFKINHFFCS